MTSQLCQSCQKILKQLQRQRDEFGGTGSTSPEGHNIYFLRHHDVFGLLKSATYCDLCAIFYDQFPPEQRGEALTYCLEPGRVRICDRGGANGFENVWPVYPVYTSIVIDYWRDGCARSFSSSAMAISVPNSGTSLQRVFLVNLDVF